MKKRKVSQYDDTRVHVLDVLLKVKSKLVSSVECRSDVTAMLCD